MFNKLPVNLNVSHSDFSYLCIMPGAKKNIISSDVRCETLFAGWTCVTWSLSTFSKKLNYFPTPKDFHK